jgi:RNA polymerase sigma-70 factor (ECF subfamily)
MLANASPRLLQEHARYLHHYALRQVRDPDLAHDLVQDTFLAALATGEAYQGRSAVRTWLVGILKHKIADAFRVRARSPLSLDALLEQGAAAAEAAGDDADPLGLGAATRENEPERAESMRRFREACRQQLARMPGKAARAFLLSAVLGHDTADVSRMLGVTDANVWTMVHRARKRLRETLADAVPA